jgi:hypothetical protein
MFDHILSVFARMTLKLSGNDASDNLHRLRIPTYNFASFKNNLWMIQVHGGQD